MFESRLIHPVRNLELNVLRSIPAQIVAMKSCIEWSPVSDIGPVTRQNFSQYMFMLGSLVKCKIVYAFFINLSASGERRKTSVLTAQDCSWAIIGRMWLSAVRCDVRSDIKWEVKWSEMRWKWIVASVKWADSHTSHLTPHTHSHSSAILHFLLRFIFVTVKFSIQIRPNNECFQSDEYCPLWRSWNLRSLKFSSLLISGENVGAK